MMIETLPKFQIGTIAFYLSQDGDRAIAIRIYGITDGATGFAYRCTRNGLGFIRDEGELLTGWEEHFPNWGSIDWGDLCFSEPVEETNLHALGDKPEPVEDEPPDQDGFAEEWQWWHDQGALESLAQEYGY